MRIPTVPAVFVRALVDSTQRAGFDVQPLLKQCDIAPELLTHDKARIPAEAFAQLSSGVMAGMRDEHAGLSGSPVRPGAFAMMCLAGIHCPTLGKFLQRAAAFHRIITDTSRFKLTPESEKVRWIFERSDTDNDPEQLLTLVTLGIVHRLSSWLVGQSIVLDSASFTHARPAHAASYQMMFRTAVHFAAPHNSLCFHSNYLDMPIIRDERMLEEFLLTPGLNMMISPDPKTSFTARIRDLISPHTAAEFPDFEWVAEQFHITAGTLRRRLREEGTSYQQLKDDLRRDTAIYHLNQGHMSIDAVAASVGFAEPPSFFRAFKRWTGVTPRAYIRRSAGD